MKVILVNGSPHRHGCTYTGLCEIEKVLNANGIETEIFQLGALPLMGCAGCGQCVATQRCFMEDAVNEFLDKAEKADGFVFGTAVHFASATGFITSFMDRVFCSKGDIFRFKPAASVVSCRRGGASSTFDMMNKYFTISQMPVVSARYWNMIHGNSPDEVRQDAEGMINMRELGQNMSWLLRCIEAGRKCGVSLPENEPMVRTNFIRQ